MIYMSDLLGMFAAVDEPASLSSTTLHRDCNEM
jgi:hypothetical protein